MRLEAALREANRQLEGLESIVLTVLLLSLVGLGLAQILMRNAFGMALPWADGAMRAIVLWLAMVAGIVAAGRFKHIRIDLLSHLLPPGLARPVHGLLMFLTALICMVMSWLSLRMLSLEFEFQTTAFLGVKTWMVQAIVPLGFAMMAVRFLFGVFIRPPPAEMVYAGAEESDTAATDTANQARIEPR